MQKKSMAKNAFFNIIYRVLNVFFPLISSTYIARVLLPAGVGSVSYAQNIVSYFTMIAALGIPTYGVRLISQNRDEKEKLNRSFSELLVLNGISTTICLIAYMGFISLVFKENIMLYFICGLLILFNYINIDWLYQGVEEYSYIAVRSSIIKSVSILLLFVFVRNSSDVYKYALITVLATGGNYVFNIFHSRKYVTITFKGISLVKHYKPILFLMISVIAAEFYSKIDITMLGASYSKDSVGYYSNAIKLVNLVNMLPTAITTIFLPRMSYYFKENRSEYNGLISKGVSVLFFLVVPCFVGVELVAEELAVVMFGEAFAPSGLTIRVLAPLMLIKSFGDLLCYQVVISSSNEKKIIFPYIITALTNGLLNSCLIPILAQNGAAIASVLSELLLNVSIFMLISRKVIKVDIDWGEMFKVMIASAMMTICVLLMKTMHLNSVYSLGSQVIVGATVYMLSSLMMKGKTMEILARKIIKR